MMEQPICSPVMASPGMGQPQYHEMQPVPYHGHPGAQRPTQQLTIQTEAQFRVAEWQRPYGDSGIHSLQQSQAPSVMSMPGSSRMSVVSVAKSCELTEQQRQKFENISLSFDPHAQPETANAAISELINLTNDEDPTVATRAMAFILNIAKRDTDEPKYQRPIIHQLEAVKAIVELLQTRENLPNLIKNALVALCYISSRPEGLQLLFYLNHQLNGLMIRKLLDFLKLDTSFQKSAIPLLHTLLSDPKNSGQSIRTAWEYGALDVLTYRLRYELQAERRMSSSAYEKLLGLIVQIIIILCQKNQEQIRHFFMIQGPQTLLDILMDFRNEALLLKTIQLLMKLTAYAEDLVSINAAIALSRVLCHGSPRLEKASLECLRSLSHVRTMFNQKEILNSVLKLLGSHDLTINQYCLDILINMCAEGGKENKEILCQNHHNITYLLQMLMHPPHDTKGEAVEGLQETILRLLRILCSDNVFENDVQLVAAGNWPILLQILSMMRPKLIWRILQLLNRLTTNNDHQKTDHHLVTFAESSFKSQDNRGFAYWIVFILKVACSSLSTADGGLVDGVKVVDIIQTSVSTLSNFCRNSHLRNEVAFILLQPEMMTVEGDRQTNIYLPLFLLDKLYPGKDEKTIKLPALTIVASTILHPQVAAIFRNNTDYIRGLQELAKMNEYGAMAEKALRNLQEGIQQPYPPLRCAPAPAGTSDKRFPPQRPSSPEIPEDLADVNPLVNVFCPTTHNSPPFSPHPPVPHPPSQQRPPPYDSLPPMNYPDPYMSNYPPGPPYLPPPQYPQYYSGPSSTPYQPSQPQFYDNYPGEYYMPR